MQLQLRSYGQVQTIDTDYMIRPICIRIGIITYDIGRNLYTYVDSALIYVAIATCLEQVYI